MPTPALPSAWANPTGPHKVAMEEEDTLNGHTIYRPEDLKALGKKEKLPIVAFAGPGCDFNGTAFRPFFTEVASHGYLVVVSGPPEPKGSSAPTAPKTKAADITASVDWAVAESQRKESKFYGHIDSAKIAIMGQSCGGLQVLSLAQDPRLTTVILWNSGIFKAGAGPTPPRSTPATSLPGMGPLMGLTKDLLQSIHVPMAYFVGKTDMASPNAQDDFAHIDHLPVFLGILDIPGDAHAGTFRQDNGGKFAVAGVAWLDWRLKGDSKAAKMFQAPDCGLCADPQWIVMKKKID